jgi:hypothetical protein
MILPTKHLSADRALIGVGTDVLTCLHAADLNISDLWSEVRKVRTDLGFSPIGFDWFTLAICFLYSIRAIDIRGDKIFVPGAKE